MNKPHTASDERRIKENVGVRVLTPTYGLIGAFIFGGAWWLLGKQYEKAKTSTSSPSMDQTPEGLSAPILSPPQERLLELIASYQKRFAATKLVVGREDGVLHFDDDPNRGTDISLVRDLYGQNDTASATRFEALVESMPPEYLRLLPEMRWDSPFVVAVTDTGQAYLRAHK